MFSSIGWMEVIIIAVVGFLVIGPDRLPGVMKEIRAIRLAIKNALADARKQLDGEFGDDLREFSEPIKEFSQPLRQFNSYRTLGAKGFIAKTLFDDDTHDRDETQDTIDKPVETTRTTTPRQTIHDYFAAPNDATPATPTPQKDLTPSGTDRPVPKNKLNHAATEPHRDGHTPREPQAHGHRSWSGFEDVL
ncbi:twin-arginine translocase TatA/TatE family subunit [Corynebacterium kroppenstedtii]|uniref:twin-arginine translocase TatA/TatE family subunit n=1 Tax=Corynebacterium sp. PCR 32 TaxID=3351342 RepID=UPI0030A2BB80